MRKLICAVLFGFTAMVHAGDLPTSRPVSATEVVVCGALGPQIMVIVVTYADGAVVRFTAEDMHGLSVEQLVQYAAVAKDAYTMGEKCGLST